MPYTSGRLTTMIILNIANIYYSSRQILYPSQLKNLLAAFTRYTTAYHQSQEFNAELT